jgi:hypothetical protein
MIVRVDIDLIAGNATEDAIADVEITGVTKK